MNGKTVRAIARITNRIAATDPKFVQDITTNIVKKVLLPTKGYSAQQQVMIGPKKLYRIMKKSIKKIKSGKDIESRDFFNGVINAWSNSKPSNLTLQKDEGIPCMDIVSILVDRLYFQRM